MQNQEHSVYIINEGGHSCNWFTEFSIDVELKTITILAHYNLYCDEYDVWSDKCKAAPTHPGYYGTSIWREENPGRIATHYFVPFDQHGWLPISNSKHIFDYPSRYL